MPNERAGRNSVKAPAADAVKREREAAMAWARKVIAARVRSQFARDMEVLDACEALFVLLGVDIQAIL